MINAETPNTPKLIVIIGFMGSGKTTVARELARLLSYRSIDLDELITDRERRTPREIIEQSGEDEFRRIETKALRQVLNERSGNSETCIIALGGGAWILPRNRELIAQHAGLAVWLDAPFELCWQRIEAATEARPLANTRETAEKLYKARQSIYELTRIRIPISHSKTLKTIAAELIDVIGRTRTSDGIAAEVQ